MHALLPEVDLLSAADAAQLLGLSVDMVRVLARDGRLPTAAKSLRGVRLFRREDVQDLAASRAGHRPPHAHVVQLYDGEEHLAGALASWVAEGLQAGGACLVIATPLHREALTDRLSHARIDASAALATERLTLLDARDVLSRFMVADRPDAARFHEHLGDAIARAHGAAPRGPLRAYGEMVDLLWKEGRRDAALALEGLWNDLAREHAFSLLCAYELRNFGAGDREPFDAVCAQHSRILPAESFPHTGSVDLRLREIARLQQRARALEDEVDRRARAEAAVRRTEEELRERNDKLTEALRAKDEFLAVLGHELRNPLAPILGAVELARRRGDGLQELETVERQVTHLVRLVDDLLDVSRLVRGNVELRPRRVELAEVVERAVELSGPFLARRRADLAVRVPASGLAVRVDVDRMTQAISNLLTNAAKYSDPGSRILVSARAAPGEVTLVVSDRGVGIAPDIIDRVFDPFVQQPQALDRAQGGLGLGLAIVRNIARLHGGSVSAHSAGAGEGTEMRLVLPAADGDGASPRPDPNDRNDGAPAKAIAHRILIVDDNADAAMLLGELLEMLGHHVEVAHTGEDALAAVPEFRPDVALLDIGLPGMDGYELGTRLREISGSLRLFAVSGYGDGANRARSAAVGFEAHLVKPVPIEKLVEVLNG
jgi:signal transduction histidine kinase